MYYYKNVVYCELSYERQMSLNGNFCIPSTTYVKKIPSSTQQLNENLTLAEQLPTYNEFIVDQITS